jgi:tetratricopeptide (TPR) repeat protein
MALRRVSAAALVFGAAAYTAAAQSSGEIQGHVTSPDGAPLASGTVRLTIDRTPNAAYRTYSFSFPLDGNGNYKGIGVVPAVYTAVVFSGDWKLMDSRDDVEVLAGQTANADFDMSRQSYLDAMSPADRKELEDYKKKNKAAIDAAIDAYDHIRKADDLLAQARESQTYARFDEAVAALQTAIQLRAGDPILWDALCDAQLGIADRSASAERVAGRSPAKAPEVRAQYDAALSSCRKALDLTPSRVLTAQAWNRMGHIFVTTGRTNEAVDAYKHAKAADPGGAARYDLNEAILLFNANEMAASASAADRAIADDPANAEAYYVKGEAVARANLPTSKVEASAAFQRYLSLQPEGAHASAVRKVLGNMGIEPKVAAKKQSAGAPAAISTVTPPPQTEPVRQAQSQAASEPQNVSDLQFSPGSELQAPSQPSSQPVVATTAEVAADRGVAVVEGPKPPAKPPVPVPHNFALIFATDSYAHWPSLQNPISDADALNEALTTLYGFKVEELKNPTQDVILRKLREYLTRHFDPQDQVMIVFSGHGYFDDDLGQGYIAPADALSVEDDLGHRTLLPHETIMNYVNRIPSNHVLLVIDACFAGTLDRRIADSPYRGDVSDVYVHATLPELLQRKETKRTRRYFASGGKDFVPDGQPGHHSPFISAFLVALNQAADRKGYATLDDLQQGLNTVNPEPRWGDIEGENDPGADFLLLTPAAVRLLTAAN